VKCLPTEELNDRALDRINLSITDDLNLLLPHSMMVPYVLELPLCKGSRLDVRSQCPVLTFHLLFILYFLIEDPAGNRTWLCEVQRVYKEFCTVFDHRPQSFSES